MEYAVNVKLVSFLTITDASQIPIAWEESQDMWYVLSVTQDLQSDQLADALLHQDVEPTTLLDNAQPTTIWSMGFASVVPVEPMIQEQENVHLVSQDSTWHLMEDALPLVLYLPADS